ncbi:DUF397 domain-containing protein [Micromonospora sp. CPM1]|uniref:DUF397 domain-containing protein n=1 Tax=Micromonospora sp. CPM1 TaxID=2944809 RepID=UPI00207C8224|nr:DUF397 domain-containing protein [Micromonospora sp. CPM1]MCO1616546.1 DUF397 domain-containing protein [Micromonospora sp. CPM1]
MWRKPSRSGGEGNCVEVAAFVDVVGARDSKDRQGSALSFDPAAWTRFVGAVRTDRLGDQG